MKKVSIREIEEAPSRGVYVTKEAVTGSLLAAALFGFLAALKWNRKTKR